MWYRRDWIIPIYVIVIIVVIGNILIHGTERNDGIYLTRISNYETVEEIVKKKGGRTWMLNLEKYPRYIHIYVCMYMYMYSWMLLYVYVLCVYEKEGREEEKEKKKKEKLK